MKKVLKGSFYLITGLSLVLILGFPMALGKGGGNSNDPSKTETVVVNGEFAYPYQRSDVPIFRGIIEGEHVGIDYNGEYGEAIVALSDAVVYKASATCPPNGGYLGNWCPFDELAGGGNYVVLKFTYEGKDIYVQYVHLETVKVKTNQTVKKGDVIGTQGHSGNSTGTHLHMEAHYGGIYAGSSMNLINPQKWFE